MGLLRGSVAQLPLKQGFSHHWFLLCFHTLDDYNLFNQRRAESRQRNAVHQKKMRRKQQNAGALNHFEAS